MNYISTDLIKDNPEDMNKREINLSRTQDRSKSDMTLFDSDSEEGDMMSLHHFTGICVKFAQV